MVSESGSKKKLRLLLLLFRVCINEGETRKGRLALLCFFESSLVPQSSASTCEVQRI